MRGQQGEDQNEAVLVVGRCDRNEKVGRYTAQP